MASPNVEYDSISRKYSLTKKVDKVTPREMNLVAIKKCNDSRVKPFLVENVFRVSGSMLVEGDICAPSPRFILDRQYADEQQALWNVYPVYDKRGQFQSDPMAGYVGFAVAGIMGRCGALKTDAIRIVSRHVKPLPHDIWYAATTGKIKKVTFEHVDHVSGTVFLKQGLKFVNDNPEQEAAFLGRERDRVALERQQAVERSRRQAVGAALGMLLIGIAANPCGPFVEPKPGITCED